MRLLLTESSYSLCEALTDRALILPLCEALTDREFILPLCEALTDRARSSQTEMLERAFVSHSGDIIGSVWPLWGLLLDYIAGYGGHSLSTLITLPNTHHLSKTQDSLFTSVHVSDLSMLSS